MVLLGLTATTFTACGDDDGAGGTTGTGGSAPADGATATGGSSGADAGADSAVVADTGADAVAAMTPPVTCSGQSDKKLAVAPAAGRNVYCAFDLGSKSAKLQVVSIEAGKPLSFKDERLCKATLGLGAKVFDAATMTKNPVPTADIANLIAVMGEFKEICALDKGTFVGAEATQWARDATNIEDVKVAVKTATAVDIEVLSTEEEGQYGYTAATRNAPEKFALDPGSNSFQIGWLEKGTTTPRTVSVDFGYVRAAGTYYAAASTDTYDVARAKHAADITAKLETALGALTPPVSIAWLKSAITDGKVKPEIFLVGQDGALHLSVRAALRDAATGKWIDTKDAYDKRVAMEKATANADFGDITTLMSPAEIDGWFTTIVQPADYDALRTKAVRDLYGEKALANTVLVDTLVKQLGLTTIVLVPQEMPAGYILAKVAKL
jgi:hypothetical protein